MPRSSTTSTRQVPRLSAAALARLEWWSIQNGDFRERVLQRQPQAIVLWDGSADV